MVTIRLGLTYNDVLLIPKKTPLESRTQANLQTRFTKNISLNIPIVTMNMASVTEHQMAIALAREGGIGIIHQFCTIEEQVQEIRKVKKSTSFIIDKPTCVTPDITIEQAKKIMSDEQVTSLLVVQNEQLIGIFTRRDYLFEQDDTKKIHEVMSKNIITAEHDIAMEDAKKILHKHRIEKLPLLKNNILTGLITTQDLKKIEQWPNATRDEKGRLRVAGAVGVKDAIVRGKALVEAGCDCIVLDMAHAHSDYVTQKIRELKKEFSVDIMVGNIVTKQAAQELIEAGADGLKVGIGPSPVCTTRIMSGAGVPQLTAIMDVCEVANTHNVPVLADGGITHPGDIVKALAAGASTIGSGSLFAGTDESPGIIVQKDGRRYKRYYGSASYDNNHETKERVENKKIKQKINAFVEGVSTLVEYKGPARDVIDHLCKGVKSGLSYCGATTIDEMKKNAEFIQITANGWQESTSRGNKISD